VVATLNSRKFLRTYINQNKLIPVLFDEIWDADNQAWMVPSAEDEPTEQKAIESFKACLSSMKTKNQVLSPFPFLGKIRKWLPNGPMIWSSS
jgi:hypothetical protein